MVSPTRSLSSHIWKWPREDTLQVAQCAWHRIAEDKRDWEMPRSPCRDLTSVVYTMRVFTGRELPDISGHDKLKS